MWKTAIIVPVPKKYSPKEYNDYRPIAPDRKVMTI